MNININFTIIEPSEALKELAIENAEHLATYFEDIIAVDIDLGRLSSDQQTGKVYYAEYNVSIPGQLVRVTKEAKDMYKAIEKVKDHLKVELEKHKAKMNQIDREVIRETKAYHLDDNDEELLDK